MTTKTYVYRGVTFNNDGDRRTIRKMDRLEKIYRGAAYFKLPNVKHLVCDHVYRGVHYMS